MERGGGEHWLGGGGLVVCMGSSADAQCSRAGVRGRRETSKVRQLAPCQGNHWHLALDD